jgi:hypothetical protein
MTHSPTEALYTRVHTRTRDGDFHGRCVTLRHVRHDRCFGDG